VDNISALVDPDTRSVVARVVAEKPWQFLKKQMYVHVLIQARQEAPVYWSRVGDVTSMTRIFPSSISRSPTAASRAST